MPCQSAQQRSFSKTKFERHQLKYHQKRTEKEILIGLFARRERFALELVPIRNEGEKSLPPSSNSDDEPDIHFKLRQDTIRINIIPRGRRGPVSCRGPQISRLPKSKFALNGNLQFLLLLG